MTIVTMIPELCLCCLLDCRAVIRFSFFFHIPLLFFEEFISGVLASHPQKSGSNVDVTRFHFGAHVFGFPGFQRVLCGAFQEYCILPKQCVFLKV